MMSFAILTLAMILAGHAAWVQRARTTPRRRNESGADVEPLPAQNVDHLDRNEATGVILLGTEDELGPRILREFTAKYGREYRQVLLISVGKVDATVWDSARGDWQTFERSAESKRLKSITRLGLDPYLAVAHDLGLKADCRISIGTDPAHELARLCRSVGRSYMRSMFSVGKVVFSSRKWIHRILHSETSDDVRMALEREGIPLKIIPVVVKGGLRN
jgi:hypothetical protein